MNGARAHARGTALVADDSRIVRRVAGRILAELGFEVVEAVDAAQTLDQARLRNPELVFLDWNIGGADGLELLGRLRALPGGADMRIVFCTAERSPERIVAALAASADEYIMKPFDSDIVESKLVLVGLLPPRARSAA